MKMQHRVLWRVLLAGAIGSMGIMPAGQAEGRDAILRFVPEGDVEVRITGTSTVNRWTCASDWFDGVFEAEITSEQLRMALRKAARGSGALGVIEEEPQSELRTRIYVEMDPGSLNCGNRRMERDLKSAIRADVYPSINFWFTGVNGEPRLLENGDEREIELPITGILVLAGEPREVTHNARIRVIHYDLFEISGTIPLHMRDFDINPPVALLGLVRAHNEITVSYSFSLRLEDNGELEQDARAAALETRMDPDSESDSGRRQTLSVKR